MITVTSSFSTSSVFEMFSVRTKMQSWPFQVRFRDGSLHIIGLNVDLNLCGRGLKLRKKLFDTFIENNFYHFEPMCLAFE